MAVLHGLTSSVSNVSGVRFVPVREKLKAQGTSEDDTSWCKKPMPAPHGWDSLALSSMTTSP